jgi:hypothetical protein
MMPHRATVVLMAVALSSAVFLVHASVVAPIPPDVSLCDRLAKYPFIFEGQAISVKPVSHIAGQEQVYAISVIIIDPLFPNEQHAKDTVVRVNYHAWSTTADIIGTNLVSKRYIYLAVPSREDKNGFPVLRVEANDLLNESQRKSVAKCVNDRSVTSEGSYSIYEKKPKASRRAVWLVDISIGVIFCIAVFALLRKHNNAV